MAGITGFTNSFTQGEIAPDAWDRVDIQPVQKGCELAENWVVTVPGPLAKRRGFWDLGAVPAEVTGARMIPFRRSITDALTLLFQDLVVWVYQANGDPLLNAGAPFSFASPYAAGQLQTLRYKQIADVIEFRTSDGQPPQCLSRINNLTWTWTVKAYDDGPWRAENTDKTKTLAFTGTDETDANPNTAGTVGSILKGTAVTILASAAYFTAAMVGAEIRVRAGDGNASAAGWVPGKNANPNWYAVSNGHIYKCLSAGTNPDFASNPPVQLSGQQSDGDNVWDYRHDGAGVVKITGVTDGLNAAGTVVSTIPVKSTQTTSFWAEGAYSNYRGWPRAWPTVREERLVEGATATDLDFLDLTQTAGFTPALEDFHPGTGIGLVIDTDAVRRRLGDDGGEILWTHIATYLIAGTTSGEFLIAGSVLDEPISPAAVVTKQLSSYGSDDVYPARAHNGVLFATRGGEVLRELSVDTNQNAGGEDLTVLANHIGQRLFSQLAWIPTPDEALWCRLSDGGAAVLTYHKEQQVKGWSTVSLPGGWVFEDVVSLPGPGRYETLWAIVSRVWNGLTQRHLWLQSRRTDFLFMDGAQRYVGPDTTTIAGLDAYEGGEVLVLANGAQISGLVVQGGQITLPKAASDVMVGLRYKCRFRSLNCDVGPLEGELSAKQRVTGVLVSLLTAEAFVGKDGETLEKVSPRKLGDVATAQARRIRKFVGAVGDTEREARIAIEDSTAYDARIYSIRPKVVTGNG